MSSPSKYPDWWIADVEAHRAFYEKARARGGSFDQGIEQMVAAVLVISLALAAIPLRSLRTRLYRPSGLLQTPVYLHINYPGL